MAEAVVVLDDVHKVYQRGSEQVHALRGISLTLRPGEVVALVGPSGSGKSTLLNVLCGWERPDGGGLRWSEALSASSGELLPWAELSLVPQALGLLEDLTVRENVALPARLARDRAAVPAGRTDELLARFEIEPLAARAPRETSLGEQQRAAVARALLLSPRLVLADEPSAHQDRVRVFLVFQALREAANAGAACLMATHDPEGFQFADRILTLQDGRVMESVN